MAEKENEGRAAKLMRKLSRKSIKVPPSVPPPSQEALPPASVRSATLPISYDSRDLALHESHSESLFSKLRRRFRLGSKGKYDFKTSGLNSPTKPRWLRRRSEETQVQHEENSVCMDTDPKTAVGKSNSVRTQRKAKSDKEEVILIRKDKRVSVICKAENGASEVIFSNVDNPDEDLSEGLSEMDEDPYATISSVKQDISKNKLAATARTQKNDAPSSSMPADASAVIWKSDKVVMDSDDYPYAKIDPSRKKELTLSQPSLQANNLSSCKVDTRVVSQIEPDYETLDDIKQKKMELISRGNMFSASNHTASLSIYSAAQSSVLDPDYESLEEVKQKSGSFNLPCHLDGSSMKQNGLTCLHSKGQISIPDKTMLEDSKIISQYSRSFGSCDMFPSRLSPLLGASLDRKRYSKTSTTVSPQESLSSSLPSPHQEGKISSSASSLTAQAPLAPTVDSSLSQDTSSSQVQTSADEECIYDNPNIILRKQVSRSGTSVSSLTRRNHTHSEPPAIKTPAEEELVEKLSALLAPPLPLRNYQKDEVYSRSGAGSARHSWSSQGSRHVESGEIIQARNSERSPLASLSPSKESLIVKSGKDSHVSPAHDRHDLLSRSNGADLHRKKEIGHLEKYLRKASPQTVGSSKLLDITKSLKAEKSDYSTINKVKKKAETNTPQSEEITSNIKTSEKMKADKDEAEGNEDGIQSQLVHKSAVMFFSNSLAENVIEEAMKECGTCESPSTDLELEQFIDLKIVEEHDLVPVEEKSKSPVAYSETQHLMSSEALEKVSNVRNIQCEENANLTLLGSSENNQPINNNIPSSLVSANKATVLDASPTLQQKKIEAENKIRNLATSNSKGKDENVKSGTSSSAAAYSLQGARPKVKHLFLEPAALTSESCARSTDVKSGPKPWSNGIGANRSENGREASVQLANDPHDLGSVKLSNEEFCERIIDKIPYPREQRKIKEKEQIKRQEKEQNAKSFTETSIKTQITTNMGSNLKSRNGVDLNKHAKVQAKRNNLMRKTTDHVLFSNPRLFANIVSHLVTGKIIMDIRYLAEGVFKWGRYFPCLDSSRHAVEMKLKAMFLFVVHMVFTPEWREVNQTGVEEMQERMDRLQIQIEKLLKDVKDFSNFDKIQHELMLNDLGYEHLNPEFFKHKENHSEIQTQMEAPPLQDMEAGDMLHSGDPYSQVDETFCLVGSGDRVPNSPSETLEEFTKLSRSHLQCRYCSVVEESDSEDELIATEVYAKTVSVSFNPRVSGRVDYISGGSYCRALHGELAYNAYMRKHRPQQKLLVAPGPDNECCGPESHLSWNNWCAIDAMFQKLVPHISPRLDFHYLLRTYSEFKHFILIGRRRKLEHKGCFTIKISGKQVKCSRFEEYVFLKIIRDEIRHFANVFSMSESRRDLFLEESDISFPLLSLLKLVLRNVHKMRRSMSKERVMDLEGDPQGEDGLNYRVHFRHTAFQKWQQCEEHLVDYTLSNRLQDFHLRNFQNFFFSFLSTTLKNWKSPQEYVHEPNVLLPSKRVFSEFDPSSQSRSDDEPRPLHEQQDFLESMEQLQSKEWYWGPISYEQATLILNDKEDGSFLVRDSSDQKYLLSLSFKSLGEVHHTRMEHAKGLFSFWSQPESHGKARICEFIEKSIQNSRDGRFLYFLRPSARGTPPLPIRLLIPVSRNFRVATLKHLSRFIVRQSVRKDHLDLLPVPEKVKRYLRDKQYYVEIQDDDQWAFDGDYGKSLK